MFLIAIMTNVFSEFFNTYILNRFTILFFSIQNLDLSAEIIKDCGKKRISYSKKVSKKRNRKGQEQKIKDSPIIPFNL